MYFHARSWTAKRKMFTLDHGLSIKAVKLVDTCAKMIRILTGCVVISKTQKQYRKCFSLLFLVRLIQLGPVMRITQDIRSTLRAIYLELLKSIVYYAWASVRLSISAWSQTSTFSLKNCLSSFEFLMCKYAKRQIDPKSLPQTNPGKHTSVTLTSLIVYIWQCKENVNKEFC